MGNPPWHFRDEKGDMAGFDVDVAKIVAKGLFGDDTKIEYVNQASDARIPNIVTDKVDITCQFMTVTAERAQQVNFTIPYYREGVGLMMTAGGKYKSRDEMKAAGAARYGFGSAERLCGRNGALCLAGSKGRPV